METYDRVAFTQSVRSAAELWLDIRDLEPCWRRVLTWRQAREIRKLLR